MKVKKHKFSYLLQDIETTQTILPTTQPTISMLPCLQKFLFFDNSQSKKGLYSKISTPFFFRTSMSIREVFGNPKKIYKTREKN